ncbi:hypothetical protein [Promineifilum sp.]|uniref:hypothetical protein n=1 Tax=Promineifilum sp. TaxID=2664178 RepID=UPI0035B0BEF4
MTTITTFVERLNIRRAARLKIALPLALLAGFLVLLGRAAAQDEPPVPTFTIENVVVDQNVTILAQNFPAWQDFVVTMGPIGTLGIDGTPVAITNSGMLGSFSATYPIPATLAGARQIAIRFESPQGYYSYNWFWNNLTGPAPTLIPTFAIESVVVNESVTIRTRDFPAGRTFMVTMGHMGTLGINGTPVGALDSGSGGALTATFLIPDELKGLERIAIRTEAAPFYSYNWFDNAPREPLAQTPTFAICGVARDEAVVIRTDPSFPPNRDFTVMMNHMGTLGTEGQVVGSFNSGPSGVGVGVFPIPAALRGLDRIAIRAEQSGGPFFSYNYFENQTAVYCQP